MRRIIAPESFEAVDGDKTLFLAGGITGAPQWQDELCEHLKDTSLVVFDPRRKNYHNSNIIREQIEWEFKKLNQAKAVSFWFPSPAKCVITMFELGVWTTRTDKPIFVGVDPEFWRKQDIEIQMNLALPKLKIVYSLGDLAAQIKDSFKENL